jgi:hypothetical protein
MKKLIFAIAMMLAGRSFAYEINRSNSFKVEICSDKMPMYVTFQTDEFETIYGLGYKNGSVGTLVLPVAGRVTEDEIKAAGSVYAWYAKVGLPNINAQIEKFCANQKPAADASLIDRATYDITQDFYINPNSGLLDFNKQPPLSHAR